MPDISILNSIPTTVSDKLNSIAQEATGAVTGALGSISSGINSFGTSLTAAAGALNKSLQLAGNLSVASLPGAATQVVKTLRPESIYKGLLPNSLQSSSEQPTETQSKKYEGALRFPSDLGEHFISLTFTQFKANSALFPRTQTNPITIHLPMSPTLTEQYQANYKKESLGILGDAAGKLTEAYLAKNPSVKNPGAAEKAGADLYKTIAEFGKSEGKDLVAGLAGTVAMNALGPIGSAISKELGAALNPHMAVIFDSVSFRNHSFSFKLYPADAKDSAELKKIISELRKRMLPPVIQTHFLGYPDQVEIKIYPKSPFPILKCVLESMSVNYAPNGPAFFKGGQGDPVGVELTLNFSEMDMFTRKTVEEYEKK